ncbi:MAG: hypothetical protein AAFU53_15885 [Cyanobacteria bacterium J06632_3]
MESIELIKALVAKEKRLKDRLSLAKMRLEAAEREHVWAIASAHNEGLSIRKIAAEMGLSSSRVHQLLHTDEAAQIPEWLTSLNFDSVNDDEPALDTQQNDTPKQVKEQIAREVEVLRWCISWLEQLARGKRVVVNLRAESDSRTDHVGVNQAWVLRVIKRVTADLDQLSGYQKAIEEAEEKEDPMAAGVKRRYRLGEPEPKMSSLSHRQQTNILREKMGLPPLGFL